MSLPQTPEAWVRLGSRIRTERERQGMSRKALAERAGVSPGSVQSAEKGAVPKGRWPQTLSAIERALGWATDSMRDVLEGGDVKYQPTLFDDSVAPAGGADQGADAVITLPDGTRQVFQAKRTHDVSATVRPTVAWWVRQFDHLDLPDEIRQALPQVMFLQASAVTHGADEWMAGAFTNALYMMLDQVSRARRAHVMQDRQPKTVEESEAWLRELEEERKRLLAGVQMMETIIDQTPPADEGEGTAGDRENRETLEKLKKELEALEDKYPPQE